MFVDPPDVSPVTGVGSVAVSGGVIFGVLICMTNGFGLFIAGAVVVLLLLNDCCGCGTVVVVASPIMAVVVAPFAVVYFGVSPCSPCMLRGG